MENEWSLRVIIADDHPIVRAGLRTLLEATAGLELIAEIDRGEDVIGMVERWWLAFDVLILDARMPNLDPIQVVRNLVAAYPTIKIMVLSSYDNLEYVTGLLNAGSRGYVLKDEPRETIIAALSIVNSGETYMSPKVAVLRLGACPTPLSLLADPARSVSPSASPPILLLACIASPCFASVR
jgi:DNA-binding NarL/FixJ family response regulator